MKALILAGGFGTRLSEETDFLPKPLVEIGGRPIIWHLMKIYSAAGINDFVVLCGYKGFLLKKYFAEYQMHTSDVFVDLENDTVEYVRRDAEPWRIRLIDTGLETMTGGRIQRVRDIVGEETFCLTYGDGLSDVNVADIIAAHRAAKRYATVMAVRSPGRFGVLDIGGDGTVERFAEKPDNESGYINAGFFVLEPQIFDYLGGDTTVWEDEPLRRLATDGQLHAYKHHGFWRPMDSLRDKRELESLWTRQPPWKLW